jgi:hypothetical protein
MRSGFIYNNKIMQMTTHVDIKKDITNRIQFVLVLAIFFPSFLVTLQIASEVVIFWSWLVGVYIVIYLWFEFMKDALPQSFLKWINLFLLLEVASFIQPILLPTTGLNKDVSGLNFFVYLVSLNAMFAIALLVFTTFVIGTGFALARKIETYFVAHKKR